MVWVRFSTFFSNLKMKNEKWTKINVHFWKIENRFEKTLHHSFFSVRLRHFPRVTFMVCGAWEDGAWLWALCCGFETKRVKYKRWVKTPKSHFAQFLGGHFWGMFWILFDRPPKKHYSALEFKVIGIVYIANIANNSIQWVST